MERRRRTILNSKTGPIILWEAMNYLKEQQWSPQQISGYMALQGKRISHERIYQYIRADNNTGKLAAHCRHKIKYNRRGRPPRTTEVKNIPNRISIHQRPPEADGKRLGDWEMDTIIGENGKGAIVTLTERSINIILMEKLS